MKIFHGFVKLLNVVILQPAQRLRSKLLVVHDLFFLFGYVWSIVQKSNFVIHQIFKNLIFDKVLILDSFLEFLVEFLFDPVFNFFQFSLQLIFLFEFLLEYLNLSFFLDLNLKFYSILVLIIEPHYCKHYNDDAGCDDRINKHQ